MTKTLVERLRASHGTGDLHLEAATALTEAWEALAFTLGDWTALQRILTVNIKETDGPDRVKWEGVWHEGPLATAYLKTMKALLEMADRNVAALNNSAQQVGEGSRASSERTQETQNG